MVTPSLAQMRIALQKQSNPAEIQQIGINEAPNMSPKTYLSPEVEDGKFVPPGGVSMKTGMPIGGVDTDMMQSGQQLMPQGAQVPQQPGAMGAPGGMPTGAPGGAPMGGLPQAQPPAQAPAAPPPPQSGGMNGNILQMTRAGNLMNAMNPNQTNKLAGGGQPKVPKFNIAPAKAAPAPEVKFEGYDAKKPSIPTLAKAFDDAIAHHVSLPPEKRIANSQRAANAVAEYLGRNKDNKPKDLLGKNEKLLKSEKGYDGQEPVSLPDGRGVETTGLALAPAYQEGKFNTCPNHASCKDECLGKTSGNYFKLGGGQDLDEFKGPRLNSLMKTQAFLRDPHSFAVKLYDEIQAAKDMAAANGNHLGVRLNVLSDINPKVHKAIIEGHPDVTFYDYTKNNTDPIAPNHHYTYSSTGASQPGVENEHTNWKQMRRRLDQGHNVAMAFSHKDHLPEELHDQETGKRYTVINGDTHDFRPLDIQPEGEAGVIVGLKNKKATGKMNEAHIDSKGFFVHYDPQLKMNPNGTYQRTKSSRISPKTGKPMLGETIPQNKVVNIHPQKRGMITITNDGEES